MKEETNLRLSVMYVLWFSALKMIAFICNQAFICSQAFSLVLTERPSGKAQGIL